MVPEAKSPPTGAAEAVIAHDAAKENADAAAGPLGSHGYDPDAPGFVGHRLLATLGGAVEPAYNRGHYGFRIAEPSARPVAADGHAVEAVEGEVADGGAGERRRDRRW